MHSCHSRGVATCCHMCIDTVGALRVWHNNSVALPIWTAVTPAGVPRAHCFLGALAVSASFPEHCPVVLLGLRECSMCCRLSVL
jgi:hypothetical protein